MKLKTFRALVDPEFRRPFLINSIPGLNSLRLAIAILAATAIDIHSI
jgi:hypothetical protein